MSSTKPSECRYFISGENKVLKVVALCPIIDSHGVPKPWNLKDGGKVFFPRVSAVYLIINSFGVGDPSDRPVKHLVWGKEGRKVCHTDAFGTYPSDAQKHCSPAESVRQKIGRPLLMCVWPIMHFAVAGLVSISIKSPEL